MPDAINVSRDIEMKKKEAREEEDRHDLPSQFGKRPKEREEEEAKLTICY